MSGFEVAGIVLGDIPLILAGLHHLEKINDYRRIRKDHKRCLGDFKFFKILYKRNLEALLRPVIDDPGLISQLISDPGSKDWCSKDLWEKLDNRLRDAYGNYMHIIGNMNEAVEELKHALYLHDVGILSQLQEDDQQQQRRSSMRPKIDFEYFKIKFSLGQSKRTEILNRLATNNDRLRKLLKTSEEISALPGSTPTIKRATLALETVFKKARMKSELLFKAFQKAWQCSCQQHHFANLRLEHRTLSEICFEVILMFTPSTSSGDHADSQWTWGEFQCGQMDNCSFPQQLLLSPPSVPHQPLKTNPSTAPLSLVKVDKKKQGAFTTASLEVPRIELNTPVGPRIKLCQRLGDQGYGDCMGIIGHDSETYHLHPLAKRKQREAGGPITLDHILSGSFEGKPTRRQRYYMAFLLASSVAQLQSTEWLSTGLTKEDVRFFPCEDEECNIPFHEPFIRQGFPSHDNSTTDGCKNDHNFDSLGIVLLELCFGQKLGDHPSRQNLPTEPKEVKEACDLMIARKWSQDVADEAGDGYASAVAWCLTGAKLAKQSWRSDIIKYVVSPLDACQAHVGAFGR